MVEKKVVDRYAHQGGVKDQLVAERDVVLTYALHALGAGLRPRPDAARPRDAAPRAT